MLIYQVKPEGMFIIFPSFIISGRFNRLRKVPYKLLLIFVIKTI